MFVFPDDTHKNLNKRFEKHFCMKNLEWDMSK